MMDLVCLQVREWCCHGLKVGLDWWVGDLGVEALVVEAVLEGVVLGVALVVAVSFGWSCIG